MIGSVQNRWMSRSPVMPSTTGEVDHPDDAGGRPEGRGRGWFAPGWFAADGGVPLVGRWFDMILLLLVARRVRWSCSDGEWSRGAPTVLSTGTYLQSTKML